MAAIDLLIDGERVEELNLVEGESFTTEIGGHTVEIQRL